MKQSQKWVLFNQTDEHADLVFKLRSLLDKANEISLNNTVKLIKSSKALQIIQSRLAYKQQLYAEALLKNMASANNEAIAEETNESAPGTSSSAIQINARSTSSNEVFGSPVNSVKKFGYLSDDDNESFVSADSVIFLLKQSLKFEQNSKFLM